MIVKYNRRALCMGDDVYNGVYDISMPDDATLADLIFILINGGNGNDWPIPMTSEIGWTVYSNVGKIADVTADKKQIDYLDPKDAKISELGIVWVFGARSDEDTSAAELSVHFIR